MSVIVPNLIHPVDVTVEQISRACTIYDPDAREPVQAANRSAAVTLPAQPRWGSSRRLEALGAGPVDNAQGYVLFRQTDLDDAKISLQINDRLSFQGREFYVVRLQPMGHYNGIPKLTRAWFADREPAKKRAALSVLQPNEVDGLAMWCDSFVVASGMSSWPNQAGGTGWNQSAVLQRPSYNQTEEIPFVQFDGSNQEFMFSLSPSSWFGSLPLSIFLVAALEAPAPSPLLGHTLSPQLRVQGSSAVYGGPGNELAFTRQTELAIYSFHFDGSYYFLRRGGVELGRASRSPTVHATTAMLLGTDDQTNFLTGRVYSILFYSRVTALTSAEIGGIELGLRGKFIDACG